MQTGGAATGGTATGGTATGGAATGGTATGGTATGGAATGGTATGGVSGAGGVTTGGTSGCGGSCPAPIGYWTFDEGSGTTAGDSSGSNRHGTLSAPAGGTVPTWIQDGARRGALHFGGTGYVRIADSSGLNFGTSGFSITAWVRYQTFDSSEYMVVSKHNAGISNNGYFIDVGRNWNAQAEANHLDFYFGADDNRVLSPQPYDDGAWHFVAATHDGGTGRLYVDGVLVGALPGSPPDNAVDVLIGGAFTYTGQFGGFIGDIDEVRLFNVPISSDFVRELHQN